MGEQATLLVVLLLLFSLWGQLADADGGQKIELAQVCSEKITNELIFTEPRQVRQLLDEALSDDAATICDDKYRPAFKQLRRVLADEVLQDVCSTLAYDRIRIFHATFIHYYLPESTGELLIKQESMQKLLIQPIPRALRHFFIMFVKQINYTCKKHLVQRATSEPEDGGVPELDDIDFEVIKGNKDKNKELAYMDKIDSWLSERAFKAGQIDKFNDLEIVGLTVGNNLPVDGAGTSSDELNQEVINKLVDDGTKLYLKVNFDDPLRRLKIACERRFMPIYMELFAPVIKLNNLGYIDRANSKELDNILRKKSFSSWFNIIGGCEVLKDIEVLHDSTGQNAVCDFIRAHSSIIASSNIEHRKVKAIQIMSDQEAQELQAKIARANDTMVPSYEPAKVMVDHVPVQFEPVMHVSKPEEFKAEIDHFEKDLRSYIRKRTSIVKRWRESLHFYLKKTLEQNKSGIRDRDESLVVGRIAVFMDRHRLAITMIGLFLSVMRLTLVLTGIAPYAG